MAQQPDREIETPLTPALPANLNQLQQQLEQLLPKRTEEKQANGADEEDEP